MPITTGQNEAEPALTADEAALVKALDGALEKVLEKTLQIALIDLLRPAAKTAMLLAAQDILAALVQAQPAVTGTKPGGPGSGGDARSSPGPEGDPPGGSGSGRSGSSKTPITIINT